MYIIKNGNGTVIYEGDNALQAKYVCAGFPEYGLYDEKGNELNKDEVFASIKRNRSSRKAKKEVTKDTPVVESTPVKTPVVEEPVKEPEVTPTVEPKKEEKKNIFTMEAIIVDHDAIIRTEASDNAPAIKNSMVHPDEKKYLKHKGDTVMAVIKKGTAVSYLDKVGSYYKLKSGYIK